MKLMGYEDWELERIRELKALYVFMLKCHLPINEFNDLSNGAYQVKFIAYTDERNSPFWDTCNVILAPEGKLGEISEQY